MNASAQCGTPIVYLSQFARLASGDRCEKIIFTKSVKFASSSSLRCFNRRSSDSYSSFNLNRCSLELGCEIFFRNCCNKPALLVPQPTMNAIQNTNQIFSKTFSRGVTGSCSAWVVNLWLYFRSSLHSRDVRWRISFLFKVVRM